MKMRPFLILFLSFLCLFETAALSREALAQSFPDKPPSSDVFVDEAQLINPADRQQINQIAKDLLREEQIALIVVTIPSLSAFGASHLRVDSYASELFDNWEIGSQARNYGMLLLVSRGDRRARIELGRDFGHGFDRESSRIMDTLIVPQFRNGDYSGGILGGVRGLDAMARGLALPKPKAPWWVLPLVIGGVVLVIGVIISLFKNGQKGWGWALIAALGLLIFYMLRVSASRSGSGGAFGGGSSGGGGASGSW